MNNTNSHADVPHDPETDFGIIKTCCEWTDNDYFWETTCGNSFIFDGCGGPAWNSFKFCPFCGNALIEQREKQ